MSDENMSTEGAPFDSKPARAKSVFIAVATKGEAAHYTAGSRNELLATLESFDAVPQDFAFYRAAPLALKSKFRL